MKKTCVLFDLDGTLCDTLPDIASAMNRALAAFSLPPLSVPRLREIISNGMRDLCSRASGIKMDDPRLEDFIALYFREYSNGLVNETALYPGIIELLETLRKENIPMAVVTNKPHANAEIVLGTLTPGYFDGLIFGARDDMPRKPNPALVTLALGALSCTAENAVLVGDSDVDFHTAKNSNVRFVAVPWGYREREHLMGLGARDFIETPAELLRYL